MFDAAHDVIPSDLLFYPTIGVGSGIKVRANFGQEEFVYNPSHSLVDEKKNEEQKLLELKKLEEQRKLEEEKKKEEKQKLKEKKQNMINTLVEFDMGFSVEQIRRALHETRYPNDLQIVINWIFDNPNAEPLPESEDEEEKKKNENEKKEDPQEKKVEQKDEKEISEKIASPSDPIQSYLPEESKEFWDLDCYSYLRSSESKDSSLEKPYKAIWDEKYLFSFFFFSILFLPLFFFFK